MKLYQLILDFTAVKLNLNLNSIFFMHQHHKTTFSLNVTTSLSPPLAEENLNLERCHANNKKIKVIHELKIKLFISASFHQICEIAAIK